MSLGDTLITLRKKKGLSQEGLAEQLHVARQTISNWENNVTSPDLQQAKALSSIFGVSLDEMVENDMKDVLIDKVSNVERLAGIVIKIIKIGFILFFLYLVVMIVGLMLYATNRNESTVVSRTEAHMTCSIDEEVYSLNIEMKEDEIVDIYGDTFLKDIATNSKLASGKSIVSYVERMVVEKGGSCE